MLPSSTGHRGGEQRRQAAFPILVLALTGLPAAAHADTREVHTPRGNYLLSCGGCHGLTGVSNSRLVPDLKDQVGFFLNLPEGRGYVVRLPNVAFSMTTDEALTDLLNYVVFTLGGTRPYTLREVSALRRKPLTEVSLVQMRQQMVRTLLDQHHAPQELLRYGEDGYGSPH